jgi:hypothetical protein
VHVSALWVDPVYNALVFQGFGRLTKHSVDYKGFVPPIFKGVT